MLYNERIIIKPNIFRNLKNYMTLEEPSPNLLLDSFNETRNTTLQLVKNLERDDFGVQTAVFMSPPKWHIGHVSWLNEIVLSKTQ